MVYSLPHWAALVFNGNSAPNTGFFRLYSMGQQSRWSYAAQHSFKSIPARIYIANW